MTLQENNAVYIISHPQGWLKVGYSKHPETRLKQHQAKSGEELKGEHIFPCENPVQVERKVHKAMASHRIMGEWFNLEPTEAADIITKTTGLKPQPFPVPLKITHDRPMDRFTIEQIKAARALLKWTAADLAHHADIGAATVRRYEAGSGVLPKATEAIQQALEDAGITFIPANGGGAGVRLKS